MCLINPAPSFHSSRTKKEEVQTHSVFPYPCLILTYWRMISKVRNGIVSFSSRTNVLLFPTDSAMTACVWLCLQECAEHCEFQLVVGYM